MLRLKGLPAVASYPRASVERAEDRILLVFAGDGGTREIDVDPRLVGEKEDPEGIELRLLARLQEIGYVVEWRRQSSPGNGEAATAEEAAPDDAAPDDAAPDDAAPDDPAPDDPAPDDDPQGPPGPTPG
jgi:hypothetical protein